MINDKFIYERKKFNIFPFEKGLRFEFDRTHIGVYYILVLLTTSRQWMSLLRYFGDKIVKSDKPMAGKEKIK